MKFSALARNTSRFIYDARQQRAYLAGFHMFSHSKRRFSREFKENENFMRTMGKKYEITMLGMHFNYITLALEF